MMPQETTTSFEEPLALLTACHDKVRRFAGLSLMLDIHIAQKGNDEEAREAARSVLRYFDLAAPLHHADEEEDLFPALHALDDPKLKCSLDKLQAEHAELAVLWQAVRPWLEAIAQNGLPVRPIELDAFASRYPAHADREEAEVYGAASLLSATELSKIGTRMCQRRMVKP
ncbi:MAG: hemerythrin domain-containing protein [Betaproteobacteria bacterium]|nr:hemerythrin domain-containing protein [Betaproteobacteria bacterium]